MNALRDWQNDFARSIFGEEDTASGRIRPNGLDPAQRLAVYRNNTFLGLTEALRDGYPVVNRLVGDDFFNGLARAYVHRRPPASGCLLEYGNDFPAFLARYAPAQGLPYLSDMARLEWLWQRAFHGADAEGLELSTLTKVPAACYGALRFSFHPTVHWLSSKYPLQRIFEVNQPDYRGDGRVSLDEGGCHLLVFRPCWEVRVLSLSEGDFRMLTALFEGADLTEAVERALHADPQFTITERLGCWLGSGLITDFHIPWQKRKPT